MAESKVTTNYLKNLLDANLISKITKLLGGDNLEFIIFYSEKEIKKMLNLNDEEIQKVMTAKRIYEAELANIETLSNCDNNTKGIKLVVSHSTLSPTTVQGGSVNLQSLNLNKVPNGVRLIFLAPLNRFGVYAYARTYDEFSKKVKKGGNIYETIKEHFIKNNPNSKKKLKKDGLPITHSDFDKEISKILYEFTLKKPGEFYNNLLLDFQEGSYIECLNTKSSVKIPKKDGQVYLDKFLRDNGKGIYIIGGCRRFNKFSSEQKIIAQYIDKNSIKDRKTLIKEIKLKIKEYRKKKVEIEKLYDSNIYFKKLVEDIFRNIKIEKPNSRINKLQIKIFLYNLKLSYDADGKDFFNESLREAIIGLALVTMLSDMTYGINMKNDYELGSDDLANNEVKSYFRKIMTPEIEEKKEDSFIYSDALRTLKNQNMFSAFRDDELKKMLTHTRGDAMQVISLYSQGRGINRKIKSKKKKRKSKKKKRKSKKKKDKK